MIERQRRIRFTARIAMLLRTFVTPGSLSREPSRCHSWRGEPGFGVAVVVLYAG
jgi:hypothetical protein